VSAVGYWALWVLVNMVGWPCFRFQVSGREEVPQHGGVLIAANHASYLDIPFLGAALRRRAWFLGRQDLFGVPGLRRFFRWLGWIPIRVDRLDRQGFGEAVELLRQGRLVVIYPEGRRSVDGRLEPGKPGIGMIVAETGCPVLPAYIDGTHAALPPGSRRLRLRPIRVIFGKPIDFSRERLCYPRREFYRYVSETVMARIAELGPVPPPAPPAPSLPEPHQAE
jgi:1-acyl-sn-glycerol-3-phosphate acyltransferase